MAQPSEATDRAPREASPERGAPVLVRARHAVLFAARSLGDALDAYGRARPGERFALAILVLRMRAKQFLMKLFPGRRFVKEKVFGFAVEGLDYNSLAFFVEEIFVRRDYEFSCQTKNPLIFDCGSNIGVALLFFKRLYPAGRVVAFEPSKQTFDMLSHNVEANQLTGVELHDAALAAAEGPAEFYESSSQPGSGWNSLRPTRLAGKPRHVNGILLSKFIREPVDFLKMDIEGAEAEVLEELAQSGRLRQIREMVVEYHHHIDPREDTLSRMLRVLEDNGFGYQIRSMPWQASARESFQDLLIRAYQK